jgi:hypothetical protein
MNWTIRTVAWSLGTAAAAATVLAILSVQPAHLWANVPPPPGGGCSATCANCTVDLKGGNFTCPGNCNKPGGTNCSACPSACTPLTEYTVDPDTGLITPSYSCPCL